MDLTVLRCLRWDREGDERLAQLSPADWAELTTFVRRKAGLPLLARRLQRSSVVPPPDIAQILRQATMQCAMRNLRLRTELVRAINTVGRPALLLKGIDLADRLYRNLGHRPMGDVDFAVRREDAAAYDEYFRRNDFEVETQPTEAMMNLSVHHHAGYYRASDRLRFELHWRVADEHFEDIEQVFSRAQSAEKIAPHALVMEPHDLFLYLCQHMADHVFDTPLTSVWDIAELVSSSVVHVDGATVMASAERMRMTKAVRIALYLANETLGVAGSVMTDWKPDPVVAASLPDILANLGQFPNTDGISGHRISVLLGATSSWRDRLAAFREAVFPPRQVVRGWYGKPGDGAWGDCRSYIRRWHDIFEKRGGAIGAWLRGRSSVVSHINRTSALRRYLEAE
jgi:hypothetical protein